MKKKEKIVVFGEILADCYLNSGEEKIGGAPFNFAFHMNKMGYDVSFASAVGRDPLGDKMLRFCRDRDFPTEFIERNHYPSGKVEIRLNENKVPRFDILKDVAYDHIKGNLFPPEGFKSKEGVAYLGTLALREKETRRTVFSFLEKMDGWEVFFDVNLREPHYSREVVEKGLKLCTILKINEDELKMIGEFFNIPFQDSIEGYREGAKETARIFGIHTVCLTLGEKGSVIYRKGHFFRKDLEPVKVVDTVGAGDGYAAVFCAGLLERRAIEEVAERASRFAARICGREGAIPLDDDYLL